LLWTCTVRAKTEHSVWFPHAVSASALRIKGEVLF
jgi:hypothetical protein